MVESLPTYAVALIGVGGALLAVAALSWALAPRKMSLKDKVVVVTGGSSGIGKATAAAVLQAGGHVALVARRQDQLESAARDLEAFKKSPSQRITVHSADLVNAAAMEAAFASIAAAHGGAIDVLVNSAGTECARRFEDTTAEDFEWILKVNVVGTRNAVAGALKYLPGGPSRSSSAASGQGRIVLISSQAGQTGVYGYTAYSASKFALNGFAQSLQMEVATRGIVVSLVFPPDTDTPMLARENQEKPRITRMLTESTSTVKPEVVASGIMSGIASGAPIIPVGFDGWMLSTLNAGMGPSGTLGNALIQVFSMGLWRLIGLAYLQYFYWVVKRNDGAGGASSSEGAGARGRTSATGSARSRSKGGSASLAAPLVSQDHKDK